MIKNCLQCNKEFEKPYNYSKKEWKNRLYCSKDCYTQSMKGKDILENNRNKIAWNKGVNGISGINNQQYRRIEKKCLECGNIFIVKNYRKDTAKFCSAKCSQMNRDNKKTSENERIRKSKEYKNWRELIYERDDWTCQKCLLRGGELNPHHIIGFSDNEELRFDINNGITFCRECHYKFHSEYGFHNNNKEQLCNFINCVASAQEA